MVMTRREEGEGKRTVVMDLLMMAAVFAFLLCYFEPGFLFSKTITTGGGYRLTLLYGPVSKGTTFFQREKISGWCQGNLAGFPMLQNYFPLPF